MGSLIEGILPEKCKVLLHRLGRLMLDAQVVSATCTVSLAFAHGIDVLHRQLVILFGLLPAAQIAVCHSQPRIGAPQIGVMLGGAQIMGDGILPFPRPQQFLSEGVFVRSLQ